MSKPKNETPEHREERLRKDRERRAAKRQMEKDLQAPIDPSPESAMNAIMDAVAASPKPPYPTDTLIYAVEDSEFACMKRRREKEVQKVQ